MAIFYTDAASFNSLQVTGSVYISSSAAIALQLKSSGSTIFSVSGSSGEIFNISDVSTSNLFSISSGSIGIFSIDNTKSVKVSGSLIVTGSTLLSSLTVTQGFTGSFTGSFSGTITNAATASYVLNAISSSYSATASLAPNYVLNTVTSSMLQPYVLNSVTSSMSVLSSSYALTASYAASIGTLTQNVTINGNLTVVGTASFTSVTGSSLLVGSNIIVLNTNNPAIRFGGISVVDSGSFGTSSTGSLFWDSQNNRWIYSNPSGSTYDGGMLISGPRNTTGLGNESGMDANFIAVGQGADHIRPGSIYNSGSLTIVTGSLTVTQGITGSFTGSLTGTLIGTASYAQTYTETDPVYSAAAGNIAFINTSNTFQSSQIIVGSLAVNTLSYTAHRIATVEVSTPKSTTTDILQIDMDSNNSPAIHIKYCIFSTSPVNVRAGNFILIADLSSLLGNGSTVKYTETTTADIGDTRDIVLQAIRDVGNPTRVLVQVVNNSVSDDYTIRFEYTIL